MDNNIIAAIKKRRSIRRYTGQDIPDNTIEQVLEAGRWAPSGLNNQPWRFIIIKDTATIHGLAELTSYGSIIEGCRTCIAVFYHAPSGYNRDRDLMAVGACIQNMLLAAESLGLGAVWLGEILNRADEACALLGTDPGYELCAVIPLGFPGESPEKDRKPLSSLVIKNF